jgi:hypothetical protein
VSLLNSRGAGKDDELTCLRCSGDQSQLLESSYEQLYMSVIAKRDVEGYNSDSEVYMK